MKTFFLLWVANYCYAFAIVLLLTIIPSFEFGTIFATIFLVLSVFISFGWTIWEYKKLKNEVGG